MMTYDKWRVEMLKYTSFGPKLRVGSVITLRDDPRQYVGVANNMHYDCAVIRYKVLSIHNNGDLVVKQLRRRKRNLFLITQHARYVLWPFDAVSLSLRNFENKKAIQKTIDNARVLHKQIYGVAGAKQALQHIKKKTR